MELSGNTKSVISALFKGSEVIEVEKLLKEQCSNNVPGCSDWDQDDLERIWLSALKISGGSMKKLHNAISLAKTDYRDLFMRAGFGYDAEAHKYWNP